MSYEIPKLPLNKKYIGVNRNKLKQVILDIYECRDKISKVLELAEISVSKSKEYYKSLDGEELQKKFNSFSPNFKVLLSNVLTYGEDLEKVMSYYSQSANIKFTYSNKF